MTCGRSRERTAMKSATEQVRPDPRLVPPAVQDVLRILRGAGKQAYLAGGAVRDLLRIAQGEKVTPPQDFDVATDALPEDVQRLFRRTAPTGIAHGTVNAMAWDPLSGELRDPFGGV